MTKAKIALILIPFSLLIIAAATPGAFADVAQTNRMAAQGIENVTGYPSSLDEDIGDITGTSTSMQMVYSTADDDNSTKCYYLVISDVNTGAIYRPSSATSTNGATIVLDDSGLYSGNVCITEPNSNLDVLTFGWGDGFSATSGHDYYIQISACGNWEGCGGWFGSEGYFYGSPYTSGGHMVDWAWNGSSWINPTPEINDLYFYITGAGGGYFSTYYALLENTTTANLYDATSTDSTILKTLPASWAVQVATTTDSYGNPITDGSGNTWFSVIDPTDGTQGWMIASSTSEQFITPYDSSTQSGLFATSSEQIATGTSTDETGNYVLGAIDHYYNDSSTVDSLYSSNDETGIDASTLDPYSLQNDISILKQRGFPEKVILGIAATEDKPDFNNQIVTKDYGHGVMQVTPNTLYYEQTDGNDYSATNDPRGYGSGVTIPPCASYMSDDYVNCYAYAGGGDGSDAHYYIPNTDFGDQTFLQYTNTVQSIYANVKDGMQILASKYGTDGDPMNRVCDNYPDPVTIYPPDVSATTTYSCTDEEMVDLTAAYNGTSTPYLSEVASSTYNISNYFPSVTSSDASTTDEINKLYAADDNSVFAELHSPGNLSIQDSHGHVIGIVNGVVTDTFPFASYDPRTKTARIFFPQDDNLTYKVTGTGTGVYGLDIVIASGTQEITFHRGENVPIVPGEVHTYTIDSTAIAQGKNGVTLKIDEKGDGTINEMDQLGATLTTIAKPKLLSLPSASFIPVVLPKLPVRKEATPPIYISPVALTHLTTTTFISSTSTQNQ